MRKTCLMVFAVCTATVLTGCGGGNSSNDLQGQWEGSLYLYPVNGYNGYNDYRFIILDDGSLWGTLSSDNYTSTSNIQSMFHGSGSTYYNDDTCDNYDEDGYCTSWSSDDTEYFDSSFTQFNFIGDTANSKLGFSGSIGRSSLDGKFSYGTPFKLSSSNYVQAASLSSIAGIYSGYATVSGGNFRSRYNLSGITISGSTLTLSTDANGCSASGTLTPHPKMQAPNGLAIVFDTSLTFSGASCMLGNGTTVQGITYQTQFTDATSAIQILTVTQDNTIGFMVTGTQ